MGVRVTSFLAVLLSLPAIAAAQNYGSSSSSPTIIQPAGYGWRNYAAVPDGPCGCAMPVRTDCYNDCCPRCCCLLRPICLLKTIHRALDCLLPCNRCCGCGPAHGCVLGGRCCTMCGPSCCPSCGGPGLGDPFIDDPPTPQPLPQPQAKPQPTSQGTGSEVRRLPPRRTSSPPTPPVMERSATAVSPWKVNGEGNMARPRSTAAGAARQMRPAVDPASGQSVLRRTSLETEAVEPAPANWRTAPVIRGQSPSDFDIPQNPLRK